MGVDIDAVLFWGVTQLDVDLDAVEPQWETKLAEVGCEVVFSTNELNLAVKDSLARHARWGGATAIDSLQPKPEWADALRAGAAVLGFPPPEGKWFFACCIC